MANLNQAFQKELDKLLDQVATDIGMLCDVELSLSATTVDLLPIEELYSKMGEGVVSCRSIYTRSACGVGGLMLPHEVAQQLSYAIMMEEPEEGAEDNFEFEGMVCEAMEEIWNILIGSWNGPASPDSRMSSKTDERTVEHYSTSMPLSDKSGLFPYALPLEYELNGLKATLGLFPPLKSIQGRELSEFTPLSSFVVSSAEDAGSSAASAAPATAAASDASAQISSDKPVVFLDYSGALLPYLRAITQSKELKCLFSDGIDPERLGQDAKAPAAAIIVGSTNEELKALAGCSFVEILPRT